MKSKCEAIRWVGGMFPALGLLVSLACGGGGGASPAPVVPPTPSFSLAAAPSNLSLAQGGSGSSTLTVAPKDGFTGTVTLSVANLPTGITASFNPVSTTTSTSVALTVSAATVPGTYAITLNGAAPGAASAATTLTLQVTSSLPSFSLSLNPTGPLTLLAGASGSVGVQVSGHNGFAGAVAFSVSGLPAGVTGTFNPVSSASASALQVTVGAAVAAGTYPFTIKGSSAGVTDATLPGSLVVTSGAAGTTDVYIAGYVNSSVPIAGYWKNGVPVALSDGSKTAVAYGVTVSGGDVYVVGYESDGDSYVMSSGVIDRYRVAKLWKNGTVTRLSDGTYNAEAHAAAVNGTDVYVAGREATTHSGTGGYSGYSVAKVWKNGVGTALTSAAGFAQASAIAFSGADVYLAGYQQVGNTYQTAVYWKNNTAVFLTDGSTVAEATGIAVSGSDVYVSGQQEAAVVGATVVKLWKNGVATSLSNGAQSDYGTGIALNGTDVLVSGSQAYAAMLWQNAQPIALTSATSAVAQTLAVTVSAGTVWLCGTYNSKAAYWDKNRQGWKLTDGTESLSSANGIFVVTH